MLSPTRNPCFLRNAPHSSVSSVPLVCRSFSMLISLFILPLQLHNLLEKFQSQQGRLATLPRKNHFAAVLPLDVLANVGFQDFVGDAKFAVAAEEVLLVEIVAVGAIQIADGPDGFDHRVVSATRSRRRRTRR